MSMYPEQIHRMTTASMLRDGASMAASTASKAASAKNATKSSSPGAPSAALATP